MDILGWEEHGPQTVGFRRQVHPHEGFSPSLGLGLQGRPGLQGQAEPRLSPEDRTGLAELTDIAFL